MKTLSFFQIALFVLVLFISQNAQAQWVNSASIYTSDADKKVGIGTSNPAEAKLVVKGSVGNTVAMFGQGQAGISLVRDWATVGFNSYYNGGWKAMSNGFGALIGCDPTTGVIQFIQNGRANGNASVTQTTPFTIMPNGNVGIGSTNPTSKLEIEGQDGLKIKGFEPFLTLLDANSNSNGRIQFAHGDMAFFKGDAAGNYIPQMVIKDNGNIGIGYAAPESKLDIAGQDGLRIFGYQPFMTLLDNNTYHSARIQAANGDIIFHRGIANWTTGKYDFTTQMVIKNNGNVGIGTNNPTFKLAVNGIIRAKEIRVETNWADYVFASDYQLRPLEEVEAFIKENKHLPEIPSASEIQENGLDVAATTTKMMAKIEELTLYLIDLKRENDALKVRVQALEKQ